MNKYGSPEPAITNHNHPSNGWFNRGYKPISPASVYAALFHFVQA
ncbi:hypothetical protein ABID29_002411 [Streptococcus rupicaprae]|uniref:Uncharacterized protein n=1 Tax=Streptococcus rupicaprae TaxID=759619 RepID=A0ABV2FL14_9STRE